LSQRRGAEPGDLEPFAEGVEACVQRKGVCCCSRCCCSETRRTSCSSRCLHTSRCRSLWPGRERRSCSCRGCSARRSAIAISSHYSWARATRRSCSDRKSTRLNSSHGYISYAVFCLKKKKNT